MLEIEKRIPENNILKKCIKHFWILETKKPVKVNHLLIPVTNVDIIFNLSAPITYLSDTSELKVSRPHILGLRNKSITIKHSGIIRIIGVSLNDFTSLSFVKMPAIESVNKIIEIEKSNRAEVLLRKKIANGGNVRDYIPLLEKKLYDTADFSLLPSEDDLHILTEFKKKEFNESSKVFCSRLCIHVKKLERLFLKYSGVPPKQYAGILRMQRLVGSLLHDKAARLTDKAFEFGYFDQTHMIKDFKNCMKEKPRIAINKAIAVKSIVQEVHV